MVSQRRPRILVIDDDSRLLAAVVTRLRSAGYDCITAGRGDEGLQRYSLSGVDLIITDMNMPGLDGVGVVRLIRNSSDVPIIILTGHAESYRDAMGRLHNITVMAKPFDSATLLRRVKSEIDISAAECEPAFSSTTKE